LQVRAVLITRGEQGMSLFEAEKAVVHIPTVAREVYDVTGAGDTVMGALSLALAARADMREAAIIANYAAGVVVGKRGTATVTRGELERALREGNL
jgi:D-beta-D-heptose 7-phosphate kinase/D-beta-D-heptose 1-phosphate adenosyltransferase